MTKPGRAVVYTLLLLAAGFAWAGIGVNVPAIRSARGVPFVMHNWAIAVPIVVLWATLAFFLARDYLRRAHGDASESLRLGVLFATAAFLFDLVVVAGIIGEGARHFGQAVLWLTYGLLLGAPRPAYRWLPRAAR